jgi:hypothetical protein
MKVMNKSWTESVTLDTNTVLKIDGISHSSLLAPVTLEPREEAELVFADNPVPALNAGEYQIAIDFCGVVNGGPQQFSQTLVNDDMKVIIPPATLVVNAANSPVIVRGTCTFANIDVQVDGEIIIEGSEINCENITIRSMVYEKLKRYGPFRLNGWDVQTEWLGCSGQEGRQD